jgi:hypothetical protein
VALKEILAMMRPEPEREPLPRDDITSRRARGGMGDGGKGEFSTYIDPQGLVKFRF